MTVNYTLQSIAVKIAASAGAALAVGGGAIIMNVNRDQAVQDQRLNTIEHALNKVEEIDRTVREVNGKVDVLNQKLDDAKEALGVSHDRVR